MLLREQCHPFYTQTELPTPRGRPKPQSLPLWTVISSSEANVIFKEVTSQRLSNQYDDSRKQCKFGTSGIGGQHSSDSLPRTINRTTSLSLSPMVPVVEPPPRRQRQKVFVLPTNRQPTDRAFLIIRHLRNLSSGQSFHP